MSTSRFVVGVTAVLGSAFLLSAFFLGRLAPPFLDWLHAVIALQVVGGLVTAWVGTRAAAPLSRGSWLAIVLVAVGMRVFMMDAPHILSDDAYRYEWDGKVSRSGINPYRFPPDAPEVAHLIEPGDERINHRDVVTVYPPLAQAAFVAAHEIAPDRPLTGLRYIFLTGEMLAWLLTGIAMARVGLPWTRLLLLAWFPLLWVQGYAPGHTDLLGIPLLTAFGLSVARMRGAWAGVAVGAAILIKPIALAFFPAARRTLGWRRTVIALGIAAATVAIAYVPVLSAGDNLFSSAKLMARAWSFNGSLAELLEPYVSPLVLRVVLGSVLAGLVGTTLLARRPPLHTALLTFTAVIICTTTLYPWYLVWMLPLLVWVPDPALLVLASTVAIADLVVGPYQTEGRWEPKVIHTLAVYVPFYACLVVGLVRRWGMFDRSPVRD